MDASYDLRWKELRPGMLVSGEADDHFQVLEGGAEEADRTEYPFTFFGVIESVTQRRLVIRGVWKWQCGDDELETDEEKRGECGVFGIIRGGVLRCSVLAPQQVWLNPIFFND